MTPVVQLYIIRIILGLIAASLSAAVAFWIGDMANYSTFFNSLTVALLVYLVSYWVLKAKYRNKIEQQSKILSTGVGMFFFFWIAFLILFYTIIIIAIPATV